MISSSNKVTGLRCFQQHGFEQQGEASGGNIFGRCPLCGKDKHFYIKPEQKVWDCKRCGHKGGFQTFLDAAFAAATEAVPLDAITGLARDRGLDPKTLNHFHVGYNSHTESFIIPILDITGKRVWDLRLYKNKKLLSTAGCHVGLFNWGALDEEKDTVYVCEGEWDGMALWEARKMAKADPAAIVAVPGAGTFKADWITSFKGKKVRVLYDNDKAGREGSLKLYNVLKALADDLQFLQWPEDTGEGFDVRDLYKREGAKKALAFIEEHLGETPPGVSEDADVLTVDPKVAIARETSKLDGQGIFPEEVYATYQKWLHLPDTVVLDFMFGTVIANRLPGDPLWGQLVGPSGATKTELLQSLTGAAMIMTATSLTPHALVSGANFSGGGDPSLLPKWNGKVVIIKDLTVLLSMNPMHREEIFSIFRDAYDGKTEKNFGNGVYRSYEIKFGIIAGVTPIIEIFAEEHTALGERFLRFPVSVPTTIKGKLDLARRAMNNTLSEDQMRAELREVAKTVLNFKFPDSVKIPLEMDERILHAAQLLALLRSTIKRDNFTKEITYKPFSEMATRLSKQFRKMLYGVALFRRLDVADERCYEVVKRIVLGTIPSRMNDILRAMYKKDRHGFYDLEDLSKHTRLPSVTTQRLLDGLTVLDVLKRSSYTGSLKPEWAFTKEALMLIETSEVYK